MEDLIKIGKNARRPGHDRRCFTAASGREPHRVQRAWRGPCGHQRGKRCLQGPQSTGILSGRADLIEAARIQASPNVYVGRGMKIGKEEIIGLITALNRYEKLEP